MSIFEKKYEIVKECPQVIPWTIYEELKNEEYKALISENNLKENVFQSFLERNPSFIPGAFGLQTESGHAPFLNTVISQPRINGLLDRKPDFLWLATNSLEFTPVFIEIEVPQKKLFNKDRGISANFTQALGQITEWKTIMSRPENVLAFKKQYSIPEFVDERKFKPIYCLIYGSRNEFERNVILTQKRAELCPPDVLLMSFDRLQANYKSRHMLCSTVKDGEYTVKHIPETHQYSPMTAEDLSYYLEFENAVKSQLLIEDDRREFLLSRYKYWHEYGGLSDKGLINSGDWE